MNVNIVTQEDLAEVLARMNKLEARLNDLTPPIKLSEWAKKRKQYSREHLSRLAKEEKFPAFRKTPRGQWWGNPVEARAWEEGRRKNSHY